MKIVVALAIFATVASVIAICVEVGTRYIDKMFRIHPPLDPTKPIVLPHAQDRYR